MMPKPAQFLLRFDDLCPTVACDGFSRFLPVIAEFGLQPILAVIPNNLDPELQVADPDPEFWARMRALQNAGAAIALHGYSHLCVSRGASLLPLHRTTEFAGVAEQTQRQWIRAGLTILRGHGLNPRIWVAPRHGFDRNTLRVLRNEGISLISDGFARVPFLRDGVTWIPQQLWTPVDKSKGLWTICVHSNTAPDSLLEQMRVFLDQHAGQFTSLDRVLAELKPRNLSLAERVYEEFALRRFQVSRRRKHTRPQLMSNAIENS
jgi:predicted deacetylase